MVHVEDIDRHAVFFAHHGGGLVHHFQSAADHFVVGDLGELGGGGVFLGVGGIDAVHACTLEHHVGTDLQCTQRRTGVGGEVGSSGSAGQDDHIALVQ